MVSECSGGSGHALLLFLQFSLSTHFSSTEFKVLCRGRDLSDQSSVQQKFTVTDVTFWMCILLVRFAVNH